MYYCLFQSMFIIGNIKIRYNNTIGRGRHCPSHVALTRHHIFGNFFFIKKPVFLTICLRSSKCFLFFLNFSDSDFFPLIWNFISLFPPELVTMTEAPSFAKRSPKLALLTLVRLFMLLNILGVVFNSSSESLSFSPSFSFCFLIILCCFFTSFTHDLSSSELASLDSYSSRSESCSSASST